VLTTTVGEAAAIALNHGTYRYPVQLGDLISDVRDGLIADILAGPDPVAISVTGANAFEITGLPGIVIYPIDVVEGTAVAPVTLDTVTVSEETRTTTVRVESFGLDTEDERALDYADALVGDLGRPETAATFAAGGVSIVGQRPAAQDTSAISGGERETRAFFDLQVAQWSRHYTIDPATLDALEDPMFIPALDGDGAHVVEIAL
jgi:hypothetical protein